MKIFFLMYCEHSQLVICLLRGFQSEGNNYQTQLLVCSYLNMCALDSSL
jgi:hypothetical protein